MYVCVADYVCMRVCMHVCVSEWVCVCMCGVYVCVCVCVVYDECYIYACFMFVCV